MYSHQKYNSIKYESIMRVSSGYMSKYNKNGQFFFKFLSTLFEDLFPAKFSDLTAQLSKSHTGGEISRIGNNTFLPG